MKKLWLSLFSMFMVVILMTGCAANEQSGATEEKDKQESTQDNVELTISAAASLQDALTDIQKSFEKEHENINLSFNFGGSGALQQQISQGAPADIFFSAAEDKFQKLVDDGIIDENNGTDLVGNGLVLVTPKGADTGINTFEDLTKADKIALGIPESVPAGQYGKDSLESLGLWSEVEGKVVYAKDVRQVLTYVETNNVDAGIVYKTDALTSDKVEIAAAAEETTHDAIVYPVGVIKNSSHFKEAELFYEYLKSDAAMKVLEEYGFKGLN